MGSLRARFNLPENIELDLGVRHVSELENFDIPAYTVGDIRIGWRPLEQLDVSLIGQNLFDDRHPEFRFPGTPQFEVEHSVHLKITFKF